MLTEQGAASGVSGNAALMMALSAVFGAMLVALPFLPNEQGENLVFLLFGFFAIAGICSTFALAAGLIHFCGRPAAADFTKDICDASAHALAVTSGRGKLLYANAAYSMLANGTEAAGPKTPERLFRGHPDAEEALYRLSLAARDSRPAREELRLPPPLGHDEGTAWYRISVRPLQPARGPDAVLWTAEDVTNERPGRELAFEELRRAIEYLDHAPAGFFACNASGAIEYMNATLADWLGCGAVGARSLKVGDFLAEGAAALVSSAPESAKKAEPAELDTSLKCRGGGTLPVRLLYAAGTRSAALVLKRQSKDQSEEKRAPEQERQGPEPRYGRVFNATPMAIAILDENGQISRWNEAFARLMPDALKPDSSGARSVYSGVLSRDHTVLSEALAGAIAGAPEIAPVDAGLTGAGQRSARLFLAAADEQDGRSAALYVLDTTEQQALQSNFAQSQKMQAIGQLAGGVAHDFNNVLTAIIGHCDLLLANLRPTDPSFRDINQIKQNANRAASLVRQLLAFSRRQTLRPQVLHLGDVLSDLQVLMRRLVGEKIDLDLRHGRDLWPVEADAHQLGHVLVNLIVNARDAMPDGGRIILRTRNIAAAECREFNESSLAAADYASIEVEDSGHGIPPELKDKIFEPFFTTKEVGKGTGLGLSMVYGIIKQTGGYVFCSSEVGKGTVFSILLPRYIRDGSKAEPGAGEAPARPADLTGHGTILLAEDEDSVRAFAARALASRGYTVLQAATGTEALQITEQKGGKIDLVVSDVIMPEMDGPTMLRELRKRGIKAKVIFVSGYAEDAFANLPAGEDFGFLPKPFTLKQLIEAVKGKQ
jgi:two-component system cell cycle sensor histidine kinase/response regulator CckA